MSRKKNALFILSYVQKLEFSIPEKNLSSHFEPIFKQRA